MEPQSNDSTRRLFDAENDGRSADRPRDRSVDASDSESPTALNRRRLLRGIGATTVAAAGAASGGASVGRAQSDDASLTFEDQTTDGESVVVTELSMPTDGELIVQDDAERNNTWFAQLEVAEGSYEGFEIELDQPIEESQTIEVWLFDGKLSEDGEFLAIDRAFVSLEDDPNAGLIGTTYVEADPEAGFHYPYFLFTPPPGDREEVSLLVEPNNTGTATDDFEAHRERAKGMIDRGLPRRISEELAVPLLVPIFPRPRSDPVDGSHYVHALDDTTMAIEDGPLERVDLQLLRMADHAREEILADSTYSLDDQLMLNGFSASGNFADRFAVLHPDRVRSVTAGGLNGMPLLPLEEADGHELPFHVGIADVEELTGEPVDLDAVDEVNQFLYMGGQDDNDTIPYDDAWTDDELRQTALAVYGDDMISERFPRSQRAYQTAGVDAQFRIYEDAGHTTRPAQDDVVEFHRRSLEGDPVDDFGQDLLARPRLEAAPESPAAGETVEFDAGDSAGGVAEIARYLWAFGDGETAVGETVTHSFDDPGEYDVTLTLVLDSGAEAERTAAISVAAADDESESGTDTESGESGAGDGSSSDDGSGSDDDSGADGLPGFGIASALGSLGGISYLLRRRLEDEET